MWRPSHTFNGHLRPDYFLHGQHLSNRPCYGLCMKRQSMILGSKQTAAGFDPALFPSEKLFYWLARPRNPVLVSNEPLTMMFIEAMLTGESVEFTYIGASKARIYRRVNVSLVFQHEPEGRTYISGYCPERSANRVFALDLIMGIHARN